LKYLPTPNEYHKYWYIDAETELIPPEGIKGIKKIWLLCASRMDSDEVHSFIGHAAIKGFFDSLRGQEVYFIGHNAISFDGLVTERHSLISS